MALNTKYYALQPLQGLFRDKDTALPMSNGKIYFYQDVVRTIPKNIFKISGTPPNYTYTVVGNSITLSSIGSYQDDDGNDFTPYLYPYDANGNIDLYYISVYNEDAVFQFSREGVPNVSGISSETTNVINYVPNGQFLAHNDLPLNGQITT
jgi:hypothetical protein